MRKTIVLFMTIGLFSCTGSVLAGEVSTTINGTTITSGGDSNTVSTDTGNGIVITSEL